MSNEIKEILDELQDENSYWLDCNFKNTSLSYDEAHLLLDYITNLQNKIDGLEDTISDNCECIYAYSEIINSRDKEIANLQEENEYLKKHQRFHKKFGNDYIFCVEGDKETYKDLLLEKQEELEDYKSRIEKTVEYINKHRVSDTISFPLMKKEMEQDVKNCFDYEFNQIYKNDLLSILNGDEDEKLHNNIL